MNPLRQLGNGTIRASILALFLLATAMLASSPTTYANTDYDADNDNLIEITTHAQLNAVRWDADGDGSSTNAGYATAFPNALTGMGCAATCAGYELSNDIDLDTDGDGTADSGDAYWNNGAGWSPMGLNTTFQGNGNSIDNLYINLTHPTDQSNRNYYVGFFGHVQSGAKIDDVGFENVNVRSTASSIWNNTTLYVGGIAGYLQGATISDSYVTGTVYGTRTNTNSTALVAVGGLVGLGRGDVVASWSEADVTAHGRGKAGSTGITAQAGGIAGRTYGDVLASYSAGSIIADGDNHSESGGLVGNTLADGSGVVASYSTAKVEAKSGAARAGGLVASFSKGTIDASYFAGTLVVPSNQTKHPINALGTGTGSNAISSVYWDTDVTGVADDANATAPEGKTTAQLQSPTTETGIYASWNVDVDNADNDNSLATGGDDPWDFGTASQYPALDYGEHSTALQWAIDYDSDNDNLIEISTHAQLNAIRWDTDGNGSASGGNTTNYAAAFPTPKSGMGCAAACAGYELSNDVDLDTNGNGRADSGDTYWNGGSGWNPIGSFNTTLKGNGNAIKGLFINRSSTQVHGQYEVGFFTSLGGSTVIDGIVFHDVDVYGATTHTGNSAGEPWAGAVAGKLAGGGTIRNVTVTGSVRAYLLSTNDSTFEAHAGGVVGNNAGTIDRAFSGAYVEAKVGNYRHAHAGGIAADNPGTIIASWFTGTVYAHGASESRAGGITGYMTWSAGSVKASYSTGKVEAANGSRRGGGIVGYLNDGTVQSTWAAGEVIATTQRGGITGNGTGGTVTNSYYDSTVLTGSLTGQGTAKTTSELQSPTAYGTGTSIYKDWNLNLDGVTGNDDPWDFGTTGQYPVIKYKSTPAAGQRAAALGQVTGLTATSDSTGSQIDLSWTAVTGVEGYVVRWKSGSEAYTATRQITNASQSTVTASITGLTAGTAYTVQVYGYKSGVKNGAAATATVTPVADHDTDDDNLIEVKTLAQLNAIRWDLDGNGTPTSSDASKYRAAFGTGSGNVACHSACTGYELRANLDFDTDGDGTADSDDAYWNNGAGFVPIGGATAFTADFDGNSDTDASGDGGPYAISNLFMNVTTTATGDNYAGLFGSLGSAAEVKNVALADVDVTHQTSTDNAHVWAGALAGQSAGTVSGIGVTGDVTARVNDEVTPGSTATQHAYAGGIIGKMTGGTLRASYVDGAVKADNHDHDARSGAYAGGIVSRIDSGRVEAVYTLGSVDTDMRASTPSGTQGESWAAGITAKLVSGTIRAVYSRADVTADGSSDGSSGNRAFRAHIFASGLVLRADGGTEVSGSYAANTSRATKDTDVFSSSTKTGGAVYSCSGSCNSVGTNSYYDSTLHPSPNDDVNATGKTTTELQSPTGYTGIYANWNIDLDSGATGTQDPWSFATARQYPVLKYGGLDTSIQVPKPGAPDAPTLVSGNTQLTATWTAPTDDGGNAINDYDVRYKVSTATTWTETPDTTNSTNALATITGLTNGTSYNVQVRAGNTDGDGPWSDSATITVGAPAAPAIPSLESGNRKLYVTWAAPADSGSSLTGFKIQYRDYNASTWTDHTFTSDGTTTTTTITGLTNNTTYLVRVAAANARGTGGWSASNGMKPGAPEPPGAPTLTSLTKELKADWNAPANNGDAIRRYQVHYRHGSGQWKDVGHNNNSTSVLISELTNGNEYQVRVRAANNRGNGRWSPVSTMKAGLPAKTATPELGTGNQSLYVEWEAPANHGSVLTGFKVQYKLNSASTWTTHTFTSTGSTRTTTITGLTNNSNYDVQVAASNEHGAGPWSDTATKKAGGPDAPVPVLNASPNATSLAVTWAEPANNGSAISDYDMRYKTESASNWTEPTATTSTLRTASITGLTTGTTYQVQLRAANERGESPWSPSARMTAGSPAQPAAPTLTPGNAQLTATWTAPANNGSAILDYDVRYKTTAGSTWSSAESVNHWQPSKNTNTVPLSVGAALDLGSPAVTGVTIDKETGLTNVYKIGSATARVRVKLDATAHNTSGSNHVAVRYSTTKPGATDNLYNTGTELWDVDLFAVDSGWWVTFTGDGWTPYLPANSYFWVTTSFATQFKDFTPRIEVEAVNTTLSRTMTGLTKVSHDVQVRALNARGFGAWSDSTAGDPGVDYDIDGDNLIEVGNLAQLNAIRWDLDGNGVASSGNETTYAAAFPNAITGMGCKATCTGYELRASLNFNTNGSAVSSANPTGADSGDDYWNDGNGWLPIGGSAGGQYTGDFDGNADTDSSGDGGPYLIQNLFIDGTTGNYAGLFAYLRGGSGKKVHDVGLFNVDVTLTPSTATDVYAGGLAGRVGRSGVSIEDSYVTGRVRAGEFTSTAVAFTANDKSVRVGGLVGYLEGALSSSASYADVTIYAKSDANTGITASAGGLVGYVSSLGSVAASYADGDVSANVTAKNTAKAYAGGLAGYVGSSVTASYARGAATSYVNVTDTSGIVGNSYAGGLVGLQNGNITASYSTGVPAATGDGTATKGGLVGVRTSGTTTTSYWDSTTSGITTAGQGTAKTTTQLKTPTAYGTGSSIYASWNIDVDNADNDNNSNTGADDPWDFGNTSQYPVLKYGAHQPLNQRHTITLSANPATIWERALTTPSRVNAATVTARLNKTHASAITVTLPTDASYTLNASTITIAAGSTTGTVNLTAVNNYVGAANKAVNLATGATINDASVNVISATPTLTINDDDELAKVTGVSVISGSIAGGINVTWTRLDAATGYVVQWKSGTQDYASTRQATVTGKVTADIAAGSLGTGSHTVRVYATKTGGVDDGPPSDEKTVPAAPAAPTLVSGGEKLSVSWAAPAGTATVTDYDLRYSTDGGSSWTDVEMDAAANTALSIDLTGLTDGTSYQVQARATSAGGDGPWSASATGAPGAPDAPAAPTLVPGNARITATWTAPADNSSTITDYDLRHSSDNGSTWTTVEMTSAANTALSYAVTTLTNGTTYQIQIRATNARGDGAWSASASMIAGAPIAPAAPTLTSGNGSLAVAWAVPANTNGASVTDYDVQYKASTDTTWTAHAHTGTSTTATIGSLTNGTNYDVQIRATNSRGVGPWSATATDSPTAQPPARMPKPNVQPGFLSVTAPANNGAAIIDYDLRYTTDDGAIWVELNPDETSTPVVIVLDVLPGGATYKIQVRAENSAGPGPWSPTSDEFTLGARAPDYPDPLTLDPGDTSMTVSWPPTQDNGDAITDYDVRYRPYGTQTWTEWDASTTSTATEVTVTGLTNGTSYYFQARATNTHGDSSWSHWFFWIPGRPDSPVITVVPGNGSLAVSWSAVDGNGSSITDYDVEYRVQGTSTWTFHPHASTNTNTTIGSLTNGTTYEVKASSRNSLGTSLDSAIVTATVGAPGRPAAPTLSSGNASLAASWTAPSTTGGSAIDDYDVRYRAEISSTWTETADTTDSTTTSATLTGLKNGATYLVQVRAGNTRANDVKADGQWSPAAAMKPGLPAKPSAPTLGAGNASLSVTWTAPSANGGTLSGFKVQYKLATDSAWTSHTFTSTGSTTTTTITGLTNDGTYNVQVAATNEHGDGPWSDSGSGTPTAQKPDAPDAPTLTVGDAKLTVSWTAPANNGASIIDYDAQYSSDGGTTWTFVEMTSAANTSRTYEITTLVNGTSYQVQVRATNGKGDSPWSSSATATPLGKPGAPAAPALVSGNARLDVSWTAPTDNGGSAITAYRVQYSVDEINWNTRHAAVNDADRTAAITGLTNGTTYYVSVAARNDQGYGQDSPSTSIKAGLPAKLRYAPELGSGDSKLDAKIFSSSADGNGSPITDYDLRYRTNGTTTWTEATDTTSTAWQQTITGLTNGTTYDVQARAQNTHGDGPWSFWATLTAGAPGAPVRPSISNGSWDFSLTWNAPGDSGSAITDYDVQYLNAVWERKKGNGSILIPDDQDGIFGYDRLPWKDWESDTVSTTRSATVTDLVPGLYYWTRIRAKNARGVGAWSEVSTARLYYPTVPDTSSNCVRNGATTLQWAWSCEIKNGVGGVGEFDTATITAGATIIKAGDRNKANDARFIAFNPNGGTATVKTYKDGAVVDTFTITVTAFAINTVTASDTTPSPGDTITVDVSLTSPFNLAFHENFLDDEFEPITDRFKRSWVQLELPTGWTGADHSGASVNQPVQVVGYNKSSVTFIVTLPSNASTEETTIPVNAYSMGLPEGCSSNANCLDDLKIKEVRNLKVNESSGSMTMSVVAADPPAQVTPTLSATTDSITAKWDAPASPAAPITGYEAQYFHDETWTTWATPAADAVSATLSGLDAGSTYRVRIRARNAHGWGDYTNPYAEITLPHAQPPDGVGSVSAQRGGGNVTIAWNAPARATGYDVVYSTNDKQSWTRLATNQSSTSYTLAGADDALSYVVAVRAINDAGESGWTNSNVVPASSTPPPPPTPDPKPQPPGSVGGLTASRVVGTIQASWNAASGATGYDVVYSTDGKASWIRAATNQSATSYTLTDASTGKSYVFAVRAVNSVGTSGWTNSASVPAVAQPPGEVASVSVTHNGNTVSVSWDAADRATAYDVVYSADNKNSWTRAATSQTATTYTLTGADPAKTYIFAVRATNPAGESGWTNSPPTTP